MKQRTYPFSEPSFCQAELNLWIKLQYFLRWTVVYSIKTTHNLLLASCNWIRTFIPDKTGICDKQFFKTFNNEFTKPFSAHLQAFVETCINVIIKDLSSFSLWLLISCTWMEWSVASQYKKDMELLVLVHISVGIIVPTCLA